MIPCETTVKRLNVLEIWESKNLHVVTLPPNLFILQLTAMMQGSWRWMNIPVTILAKSSITSKFLKRTVDNDTGSMTNTNKKDLIDLLVSPSRNYNFTFPRTFFELRTNLRLIGNLFMLLNVMFQNDEEDHAWEDLLTCSLALQDLWTNLTALSRQNDTTLTVWTTCMFNTYQSQQKTQTFAVWWTTEYTFHETKIHTHRSTKTTTAESSIIWRFSSNVSGPISIISRQLTCLVRLRPSKSWQRSEFCNLNVTAATDLGKLTNKLSKFCNIPEETFLCSNNGFCLSCDEAFCLPKMSCR